MNQLSGRQPMLDYRYDRETPGYDASKVGQLFAALHALIETEFPQVSTRVQAVNYPPGSVRLINLEYLDDDSRDHLTTRADEVFTRVMTVG
jgi:hypothetical protein